jgi:hypothetical protein
MVGLSPTPPKRRCSIMGALKALTGSTVPASSRPEAARKRGASARSVARVRATRSGRTSASAKCPLPRGQQHGEHPENRVAGNNEVPRNAYSMTHARLTSRRVMRTDEDRHSYARADQDCGARRPSKPSAVRSSFEHARGLLWQCARARSVTFSGVTIPK